MDALISLAYNAGSNIFTDSNIYSITIGIINDIGTGKTKGDELYSNTLWEGQKAEDTDLIPRRERERIIMNYGLYINKNAETVDELFIQ